ncbi:endoplasmic reticulum-Golgi intermediate compartment protein 2 [Folsomia candida]|nr:endoplasmic reticulum-Golgi intermediate compartment protein 2 [Folsomia candida]
MSGQPQIRRRKPAVLKAVEEMDAFPKVPETCIETTSYGGTASIVALIIIAWLVIMEFSYFLDTGFTFKFSPDTDLDEKLTINIDLTVGMPCSIIGADIVDSTSQNVMKFGELEEEFVYFELSESQRAYFNAKARLNSYLREQYHSLQNLLWKNDFINMYTEMPKLTSHEKFDRGPAMACRLYGSLELNKVAGNFHITAGKTLPLPRGHAHVAAFMSNRDYNFSHRIYKFSFGDGMPTIVHPLEGTEAVANINHMSYQYFIQVVPTIVKTRFKTYRTFQYSVRELPREIDHEKGSHGVSGIFFKYDMSGLKVVVEEEEYPVWRFLVRLCAVIGGVYTTVGMMYNHLSVLGCSFRRFRRPTDKTHDYTRIGGSESLSASPSPLVSKNVNPIVSSSLSTSNVSLSQPNFESPVVQFLGQEKSPLLCDIAADSDFAVTNLESENPNNVLLPDILSSHTSN